MWVNFAGLSAQVVFAAWVKPSCQTRFVKKCQGVAGVAGRCPQAWVVFEWQVWFGQTLQSNNKFFFSSWRCYIMIYGHIILSLSNEMGPLSKIWTCIKICQQGTKTDHTANSPRGQKLPSLLSVGGYGGMNHVMASLALSASTCRASWHQSNRQLRGHRLPRSGIPRKDPSLWAVMVNAEGLQRLRLPLARWLRFPTAIPCAMPVCSGFMQGWNIWPIVWERAEGRNFPKRSVLAALFCR